MFSCIHNGIVVFVKANKVARAKHTNEALQPRYSYSAKGRLQSFEALFMILLRHQRTVTIQVGYNHATIITVHSSRVDCKLNSRSVADLVLNLTAQAKRMNLFFYPVVRQQTNSYVLFWENLRLNCFFFRDLPTLTVAQLRWTFYVSNFLFGTHKPL